METSRLKRFTKTYPDNNNCCRSTIWFIVATLLFTLFISPVFAEDIKTIMKNDFDLILNATTTRTIHPNDTQKPQQEISPISFVAFGLLTIYQKVISSQDRSVCNFTPSCSRFAREAINQAGFMRGTLMAADRILRCHPYSLNLYEIDANSRKAYDPVKNYMDEH